MAKTSIKDRKPYKVYEPDFSDLNRLYENDVVINDVDMALRNKHLRGVVDSMLVDMSPDEQSMQLTDDQFMDSFIGKEFEPDEINILAHKYADQYQKELSKFRSNNARSSDRA